MPAGPPTSSKRTKEVIIGKEWNLIQIWIFILMLTKRFGMSWMPLLFFPHNDNFIVGFFKFKAMDIGFSSQVHFILVFYKNIRKNTNFLNFSFARCILWKNSQSSYLSSICFILNMLKIFIRYEFFSWFLYSTNQKSEIYFLKRLPKILQKILV